MKIFYEANLLSWKHHFKLFYLSSFFRFDHGYTGGVENPGPGNIYRLSLYGVTALSSFYVISTAFTHYYLLSYITRKCV